MSVLYSGDFQSGSWNGYNFAVLSSNVPPLKLDDNLETSHGETGAMHGSCAGTRVTVGDMTITCLYDSDWFDLPIGADDGEVIADTVQMVYTIPGIVAATMTVETEDMVLAGVEPGEVSLKNQPTMVLTFKQHAPEGGSVPTAVVV